MIYEQTHHLFVFQSLPCDDDFLTGSYAPQELGEVRLCVMNVDHGHDGKGRLSNRLSLYAGDFRLRQ